MKTIASASAPLASSVRAASCDLARIDGVRTRSVGEHALVDLDAQVARHDRGEIAPEAPGARPVAAAHFEHVAKAAAW